MVTKIIKYCVLFILFITLSATSCGDENQCGDTPVAKLHNIVKIEPEQLTYNQGDVITLKIEIPSNNNYFGRNINLVEETRDYEGSCFFPNPIFNVENEISIVKGIILGRSYYTEVKLPYNFITGKYELELVIKLNKVGVFNAVSGFEGIGFKGNDKCEYYNIKENYNEAKNFMVQ